MRGLDAGCDRCPVVAYQPAGIGYYTKRLSEALAARPRPFALTVLESRKQTGRVVAQPSVRVGRLWTPPHHRWEQATLALELLPRTIDLLHSPDFIPPFFRRCRSVITVHDLAFVHFPHLLTADSRRYYGQVAAATRSADAIIAVSTATADDLIQHAGVPAGKIAVILEAADPYFQPSDPTTVTRNGVGGRFAGVPYLFFIGTLEPRKNLPVLLKAFSRLRQAGRPEQLVLAGGRGWLADDLDGLIASLGLNDAVHLIGRLSPPALRSLYWGAQALVLPSLYEGFGLTAVEAMACGTPVVASRAGALPEVVGDAGLLFNPADDHELADLLERVLDEPALRADLVARGLRQAATMSWERAADETAALYQHVLAR